MRKTLNFSKGFVPSAIVSFVLIAFGVIGFFVKGINLGLDFKPGMIEEVSIGAEKAVTIDSVRKSLKEFKGADIKSVGSSVTEEVKAEGEDKSVKTVKNSFQIRLSASEDATKSDEDLANEIYTALETAYGKDNVKLVKSEKISPSFSKSLAFKSLIVMILTIVLIWVYAAFRFHWDFALGSVLALIHDTLIMFTFVIWTQMEFTTTVLAAILTIIGYSINATVVILDRVRFNLNNKKVEKFTELLNVSLSDTLSRSIITTLTTLFAVLSLYIFTTGSIQDFALAMIVGLISGAYSSIFVSSGLIALIRKNWKPEFGIHHSEKSMKKGVLNMDAGVQV